MRPLRSYDRRLYPSRVSWYIDSQDKLETHQNAEHIQVELHKYVPLHVPMR